VTNVVDRLLTLNSTLVYVVVAALVFAEDALFVGFVLPGETAAVLGGVDHQPGPSSPLDHHGSGNRRGNCR